ncbi:MAG: SpoIIE family protein phosphatase [Roseateles sp.]|uniref:SpoIIE family protein phosphatase n=1 Tax=Roseateles sp. TaxID=1971397 RepID=UPI0040354429
MVVVTGQEPGRRIPLLDKPLVIGRRTAADLVLPELQVSGLHCRIQVDADRPALKVTDLKSTNGSFINGRRITGSAYLAPGSLLAVGQHLFRHDFEPPELRVRAAQGDTERASSVAAWLPAPGRDRHQPGPVHTDHCYHPAEPPRGAGFATLALPGDRVGFLLIDVCGPHGHAAQHAVRVLRELRAIHDVGGPAELFGLLHARWGESDNGGLFFTAWAAVYDPAKRRLSHACAGQHPALLRVPDGEIQRLDAINPPIGLLPDTEFVEESLSVPPGSRLHIFNKGAFDVIDRSGRRLELDDFEALLACLPPARGSVPEQAFAQLRQQAGHVTLDDDFLLVQAEFV